MKKELDPSAYLVLKKLKKRPLAKKQIATGMNFCYCNAKDLFSEAVILRKHQHYARAFSLCVLALEELAKITLILNGLLLKKQDEQSWNKFWKILSSHDRKQSVWAYYGKKLEKREQKKFYKMGYGKDFPLDKLKQLGFYVDFFDGNPVKPETIFRDNKVLIDFIFKMTRDRLKSFYRLHSTLKFSSQMVEKIMKLMPVLHKLKNKIFDN